MLPSSPEPSESMKAGVARRAGIFLLGIALGFLLLYLFQGQRGPSGPKDRRTGDTPAERARANADPRNDPAWEGNQAEPEPAQGGEPPADPAGDPGGG